MIRRLSSDFGGTRHDAQKPDCPPPYTGGDDDVLSNRDRVAKQVAAMFGD
ncbi:hypothetical protein [Novosphingobium kaempferiae]|nr:hypothetical protein [Novosphingobium kaempferiae]